MSSCPPLGMRRALSGLKTTQESVMPTPAYISITGTTQGNITQGAFTADSVGNVYVEGGTG